jgi:hypothetical protein
MENSPRLTESQLMEMMGISETKGERKRQILLHKNTVFEIVTKSHMKAA